MQRLILALLTREEAYLSKLLNSYSIPKLVSFLFNSVSKIHNFWDFYWFLHNRRQQEGGCEKKKIDSLHPSLSRLIKLKALKDITVC